MLRKIYRIIIPHNIRVKFWKYRTLKKDKKLYAVLESYYIGAGAYESQNYVNELTFLKNENRAWIFPYEFIKKYNYENIVVKFDKSIKLHYVEHLGKKLYFPKDMDKRQVQSTYNSLLLEQDENSPHRYMTKSFTMNPGSIMVDVGSAEGIIALETIESAKFSYIFETEERWIEALEATFFPYKEKVAIINKFVSDKENNYEVTLDSFSKHSDEIFIKIDVEGAEAKVLKGAEKILNRDKTKIVCCTYHKKNDAEEFQQLFEKKKYQTEFSKGYMLLFPDERIEPPYFRKGLIRAWKQ